jgi:putative SOS response-associated peptidase YedK
VHSRLRSRIYARPRATLFHTAVGLFDQGGDGIGIGDIDSVAARTSETVAPAYSTFNARAEEFMAKPAFRDAWKRGQRCLVVTDGFYEWKKLDEKGKDKQPYAIAMADVGQMVMAGLWAKWKDPKSGDEIQSCTILTCGPNDVMAELHNRMPVILAEVAGRRACHREGANGAPQTLPRRPSENLAGG